MSTHQLTILTMKNFFLCLSLLVVSLNTQTSARAADAPAPNEPSLEQRVADLEAYVNNGARQNASATNLATKVPGPGPGHNAFQMVSAALVLFMTLPGLALFYEIGRAHV